MNAGSWFLQMRLYPFCANHASVCNNSGQLQTKHSARPLKGSSRQVHHGSLQFFKWRRDVVKKHSDSLAYALLKMKNYLSDMVISLFSMIRLRAGRGDLVPMPTKKLHHLIPLHRSALLNSIIQHLATKLR